MSIKRLLRIYHKGFISSYFLSIFFFVISVCSILLINLQHQVAIVSNAFALEPYLKTETAVMAYVKNHLELNDLSDSTVQYATYQFAIQMDEDCIHVRIDEPIQETLRIELKDHNVYEYKCIRSTNAN